MTVRIASEQGAESSLPGLTQEAAASCMDGLRVGMEQLATVVSREQL